MKDAIVDRFRAAMASRPSVNTSTPDMRIHVFLTAYKATVYLDLAGEALFKRGYRREGLLAPLRENLAAGILMKIEPRKAGVILNEMDSKAAAALTTIMVSAGTTANTGTPKWNGTGSVTHGASATPWKLPMPMVQPGSRRR